MNDDEMQLNSVDRKKLERYTPFMEDDKGFTMLQEMEMMNEKMDEKMAKDKEMHKEMMDKMEMPEMPEKVKVEIEGAEVITIQGKPGETPTDEHLVELIKPLIPEPIKGDDYVLTEKDKKEIASKIQVPVVEKIVETIIEKQPIITNEIKEVAKYEEPDQIIDKINSAEGKIDKERIDGFEDEIKRLDKKIDSKPTGGGVSALAVARAFKYIFHTEAPSGAINGSNVTYTVQNNIWAIISFTLNGESIAELPNYTFVNKTITFASALPSAYSSKDFEVKYIGT